MDNLGASWERYKQYYTWNPDVGLGLDISAMRFEAGYWNSIADKWAAALKEMQEIEAGEIVNRSENWMVGHYWLRAPNTAPSEEIAEQIRSALTSVKDFAEHFFAEGRFEHLVCLGIGGSALGPQFVNQALRERDRGIKVHFVDNTDPLGMQRALDSISDLSTALCLVTSKSGGTQETFNAMCVFQAAYKAADIDPAQHMVAITMEGSSLWERAQSEKWLQRFPIWNWVGGRTGVWSASGLVPAVLGGVDIDELLEGARAMDVWTREADILRNPAGMLVAMWYHATKGRGEKSMVVIPYSDGLSLLGRYLQQLVMESLGKEQDHSGNVVNQGISVFGNKGSTDQHAYVQQLREGLSDCFVNFIQILNVGANQEGRRFSAFSTEVQPGLRSSDYLAGFLNGTRKALVERGRESLTIDLVDVSERRIGALLALYERAVGYYGSFVGINAYDQPGVEAGKLAARGLISLQESALKLLSSRGSCTVDELSADLGDDISSEYLFGILRRLSAEGRISANYKENIFDTTFSVSE